MKTTFAALLALAGAAYAAPAANAPVTVTERATTPYPFSIDDIKLYHLKESNTWDLTIKVTERDPYGAALGSTTCHSAWNDGATYVAREICEDTHYFFWLPNGAPDPEHWSVIVDGPAGQAEGTIDFGNKYKCGPYEGTIGNIDRECTTTNGGWFFLHEREV
ncbi:uncharacterized protein DSM5745_02515 [Aspergillus mulundensis]|uniref:AA1-like domain-containing protein n=1 Tax=Aspergillus mulundensis TaxID=1810919 RepID=A0A3D8SWT7_9EURO|nr:Uncharacterized protein DSM5745_02515 [Aspergillus mulundensis]RDW90740.1 Uncharacterized protein DSM5745_02515 [Aspergillus mulundensis]